MNPYLKRNPTLIHGGFMIKPKGWQASAGEKDPPVLRWRRPIVVDPPVVEQVW